MTLLRTEGAVALKDEHKWKNTERREGQRHRAPNGVNKERSKTASGEFSPRPALPVEWLRVAARLPGRSLHVAVALRVISHLQNSLSIPLSNIVMMQFGVDRNSKYRGLIWLEKAGLVTARRKVGRAPIVTILDAEAEP